MSYALFDPAFGAFILIPILLLALLVWGVVYAWRRSGAQPSATLWAALLTAVGGAIWMGVTWALADRGVFREWAKDPPPFGLLMVGVIILSIAIAFSGLGRKLALFVPLWVLVAVQAFRLPLELSMHAMYERGIMPGIMSYSGRNFDILTGATAILVAVTLAAGFSVRWLIWAWNIVGLALLVNVVSVAVLATPRFRFFGDDQLNVWVTSAPYVWLPAVMVIAAFTGHFLIFRALLNQNAQS